ncbi:hypothetical protein NO2_0410 [Candidatus Termititenax persephonae]|uniref:Uncharacterized protein n=1 Tax=Candidatus Termititenax persephonae TaxID=2218525 RepID=A0A388TFE2_9BACT|nr:hypothetical protein NO2_0410 [Candidatus Termititenax persephonae]
MNMKNGNSFNAYTTENRIAIKETDETIYTFTRIPLSEYQQAYDDAVVEGNPGKILQAQHRLDAALVHTPIDFTSNNVTTRLWREPETWPAE